MPTPRQLIDSSFLYSLYNADDPEHKRVLKSLQRNTGQRIVPDVVLPEVTFLFNRFGGQPATTSFVRALAITRPTLEPVTYVDLERVQTIMSEYPRARLDFVDCCIMSMAERLNITQICTLDHRDFGFVRPRHTAYFEILPD